MDGVADMDVDCCVIGEDVLPAHLKTKPMPYIPPDVLVPAYTVQYASPAPKTKAQRRAARRNKAYVPVYYGAYWFIQFVIILRKMH